METIRYQHTQTGRWLFYVFGLVALAMIVALVTIEINPVGVIAVLLIILALAVFSSLTVTVTDDAVRIRFGLGCFRKRFALSDISDVRVVRNSWLYGWGIRVTPHGWLYNVAGLDAVELEMKSGRHYRIGSDQAGELYAAIRAAIARPADH